MVPYDERVFSGARVIDGIRTAFPIHAYLDLEGYRGRGKKPQAGSVHTGTTSC